MREETAKKIENIKHYSFFESIGKPLPNSVTTVPSWSAAARLCRSRRWEACRLAARNKLQNITERQFWIRSERWNPSVREIRPAINSLVASLEPKIPLTGQPLKGVANSLAWDLLFICLETEYSDIVAPMFYVPMLDHWFQEGHFGCSWDGDEWPRDREWDGVIPNGKLMVL